MIYINLQHTEKERAIRTERREDKNTQGETERQRERKKGGCPYLQLSEEYAAACPLHNGEERLVGHLAHEAEGVELLVLAPAGLLLLQVGQDLGLHLRLVWLALEQLHDEVREAGRRAALVRVHVRVAHDGLRRAGVRVGVLGLDGATLEVAVGGLVVALQAAGVWRHGHADGRRDEGAAVVVDWRQRGVA